MLDDKLLIEYIKYIVTNYSNEYGLIAKIKFYGFDVFNLNNLTKKEKQILSELKENIKEV